MSEEQAVVTKTKKNWFLRHKIISAFLGLIIIFILIGISGGNDIETTSTAQPNTSDNNAATAPATTEISKIGDTVTDEDMAFTVNKVGTAKTIGTNPYLKKTASGTFHIVSVKIANSGNETKTIDSSMFQVIDSKGRTFDRSSDAAIAQGFDLFLKQVQPGLSITGDVTFDLPEDATELQLVVKGSYFGTGSRISLEK